MIETITTTAPIEPTEPIEILNKRLVDTYGKDVAVDLPKYKIVWSSDQYEWRNNDPDGFDIYDESGTIFLRTEYGPHEVPKYPLNENQWVLEAIRAKTALDVAQLVEGKEYSYEPLWHFGAGNSNPQPIWKAVNFLVHAHIFKQNVIKKTNKDLLAEDLVKIAKEKEDCLMYLRSENPFIHAQLRAGEAEIISNTDYLIKENPDGK